MNILSFFEEKIMHKDGCNIYYWTLRDSGGPWLVFLHGAGTDHRMFSEQIPLFAGRFKILLWDARGHGLSRPMGKEFSIKLLVSDLIEIMCREKIDKATLIGQSMGGNTSQELLFYHPDKVESIVLIDCTSNTMKLSFSEKLLINSAPILLRLLPWKYMVGYSARVSSVKAHVQGYLKEVFQLTGKKNFSTMLLETIACMHYEKDYRINRAMLLLCGENDKLGNIKKASQAWALREDNCEFHLIKDAGHCSNQDNADELNKWLNNFLSMYYGISL